MYQVLIVDDEEIVCRGMAQFVKWEKCVIRIIGMFRHNSCNSHRIWPYRIGARHMEDHRIAVQRLRAFKHCKIIDRAGLPQRIICKCDILRCQRFPVRKFDIIADCHRPCQSILRGFHIGSQIITNPQIRRCHRKPQSS